MAKERITDVVMDDASINVSKEVDLVFSIANSLRGAYKSDKYKDVIIPMIIIRRFECALANTKDAVVAAFEAKRDVPPQILEKVAGYKFYNTSRYTLAELLNDSDNIVSNFKSYIEGFSANVQSIIHNLDFEKEIDKMDKNNRLLGVVRKFSELDLNPTTVDGIKAGYMFEEIMLSVIIEEINTIYGSKGDTGVRTKAAMQIRDILLKDARLRASAKNNPFSDFKFTYKDSVSDALVSGYDENVDFYTLLLGNEELRDKITEVYMKEVYESLRGGK